MYEAFTTVSVLADWTIVYLDENGWVVMWGFGNG